MDLRDLLSELRENILHDRSQQIAGANSSYLWSDATLVRYIDEAQRRLARLTGCIRDKSSPEICQFVTVANRDEYPLHKAVVSVLSARFEGDAADLPRAGHSQLDTISGNRPDPYFWDASTLTTMPPGKPLAFTTDEDQGVDDDGAMSVVNLRLWPMPNSTYAAKTVSLRVTRLPLVRLSTSNLDAVPEVPETYHFQMLDWAAYLALRIVDVDGGQAARAAEFKAAFAQTVNEINVELKDKIAQPAFIGFGRGGWAYER